MPLPLLLPRKPPWIPLGQPHSNRIPISHKWFRFESHPDSLYLRSKNQPHSRLMLRLLMTETPSYQIFALGDNAVTIDLGNRICNGLNQKALSIEAWVRSHPFPGLRDIILGYSSLSVLYDPFQLHRKYKLQSTAFEFVKEKLEEAYLKTPDHQKVNEEIIYLPVCYDADFGPDLSCISSKKQLEVEEIIQIHLSKTYRVYMMGFLPGFPYMGEVDERIRVPRKLKPENVLAGSVGIANGQTGIYPVNSPGGWQIIGRTPVKLFDAAASQPVKLKAGQTVQFQRITINEFHEMSAAQ